jgi:hypothetical protein
VVVYIVWVLTRVLGGRWRVYGGWVARVDSETEGASEDCGCGLFGGYG